MIEIGPTEMQYIYIVGSFVVGFIFAKYPEWPIIIKRSIKKAKVKMEEVPEDMIPEDAKELFKETYNEILAWEAALEDGKLSWKEMYSLSIGVYRLAKAILKKLGI